MYGRYIHARYDSTRTGLRAQLSQQVSKLAENHQAAMVDVERTKSKCDDALLVLDERLSAARQKNLELKQAHGIALTGQVRAGLVPHSSCL